MDTGNLSGSLLALEVFGSTGMSSAEQARAICHSWAKHASHIDTSSCRIFPRDGASIPQDADERAAFRGHYELLYHRGHQCQWFDVSFHQIAYQLLAVTVPGGEPTAEHTKQLLNEVLSELDKILKRDIVKAYRMAAALLYDVDDPDEARKATGGLYRRFEPIERGNNFIRQLGNASGAKDEKILAICRSVARAMEQKANQLQPNIAPLEEEFGSSLDAGDLLDAIDSLPDELATGEHKIECKWPGRRLAQGPLFRKARLATGPILLRRKWRAKDLDVASVDEQSQTIQFVVRKPYGPQRLARLQEKLEHQLQWVMWEEFLWPAVGGSVFVILALLGYWIVTAWTIPQMKKAAEENPTSMESAAPESE